MVEQGEWLAFSGMLCTFGAEPSYDRNVLKLRKQEAAARAAEREEFERQASMNPVARPPVQTTFNSAALDTKVRVARKSVAQKPRTSIAAAADDAGGRPAPVPIDKEVLRRATWKVSFLRISLDVCD